jgi:WD40 repeat protein
MHSLPRFHSFALLLACGVSVESAEPKLDRFGDPLPEGAIARLGSLRLRHKSSVRVADFSADGKLIAAFDATGANTVIFWDTATGREARRVPIGYVSRPRWIRLSQDGKSLILADGEGIFRVLDAVSGVERLKLEPRKVDPRYSDIRALDVSRDGKTAVSIYHQNILVIWDLAGGKRLREIAFPNDLERHSQQPIVLTPDGKHLVLPYKDGTLHLLNAISGKEVLAIEMPSKPRPKIPPRVAISPDGRWLAYGGTTIFTPDSPNKSIALCDLTTGKRLRELSMDSRILEWVFTPDSRFIALSDADTIRLFDVSSGKVTRTFPKSKGAGLAFSPDGRKLAASFGTCIYLWDAGTGELLHSPLGHDWFIREIHFFPDGKRLVSSISGEMIVWDVTASRPLASHSSGKLQRWISVTSKGDAVRFLDWIYRPLPPNQRKGKDIGLNERGLEKEEIVRPSGMVIEKIYRWDMAANRKEEQTVFTTPAACDWFVLSPDGLRMAVVTNAAEPRVYLDDVKGARPTVSAVLPDKSRVIELLFSTDGRRVLVRTWHGALRVLDSASGQTVRDLKPDSTGRRMSSTAVLSPDGRSVVLSDDRLYIREVASGKDRIQIAPTGPSGGSVLSPNGKFLALYFQNGNEDGLRVFSTATGKILAQWRGDQNRVTALAFSPDSRFLASGGYDGTIFLWKVPENDGLPPNLSKEESVTFWQTLADDDAARANRALAGLAAAPAQAVPLIKERFQTVWKMPDAKRIAQWISELDDDDFKVRERAMRALSEIGADAADAIRRALANPPSAEARNRMQSLLNRLGKGGDPERLRCLRAVEVLERIGTAAARNVLRDLAGKPLPAELSDEIHASLRRMSERP